MKSVVKKLSPLELLRLRRDHAQRYAAESGSAGEASSAGLNLTWIPRPRGAALRLLLEELAAKDIHIQGSSFDFIAIPDGVDFDLSNRQLIREALPLITFIEVKSTNSERVQPGFRNFFFALTEKEILASDQLGHRHAVVLFNRRTEEMYYTDVPTILDKSRSTNWQVSVQL